MDETPPNQFHAGIKGLDISQRTIDIAYGVLVLGQAQTVFITSLGLFKGAVSQAVSRAWALSRRSTCHQDMNACRQSCRNSRRVRKWAEDAARKLEFRT